MLSIQQEKGRSSHLEQLQSVVSTNRLPMKWLYVWLSVAVAIALTVFNPAPEMVQAASGCDKSYPDFCIPPAPPDLNCKDISQKNFRVLPPDPHGFDRDKDGIGCEAKRR